MADKTRTPEELKDLKYNYFYAFKIDLKQTKPDLIEKTIKTALSSAAGDLYGRRLLELKDDALQIMVNDVGGARSKEAAAAKALGLKEATQTISKIFQTREMVLKSEILEASRRFNASVKLFEDDELVSAIEAAMKGTKARIIDNIDNSIPFNDFKKIDELLNTLSKKNLYDYLGMPNNASAADLKAAKDKLYSDSQKGNDLKKKQAHSSICGSAQKILIDKPDVRKAYDQYILIKNDVWQIFDDKRKLGLKELLLDEYLEFANLIKSKLGVTPNEAEKILAVGCKFFGITPVGSAGAGFDVCPNCGNLIPKGSKSCPNCGKSLEQACWNCGQVRKMDPRDIACTLCGATNKAKIVYDTKCKEFDNVISAPVVDIPKAKSILLDIKNLVPSYSKAPNGMIAKRVANYTSAVNDAEKVEETLGKNYRDDYAAIRVFINKKEFVNALNNARKLQTKYGTYRADDTNKIIAEINTELAKAKRYVDAAKGTLDKNVIVSNAVEALKICADYIEAKQMLQKYPPMPVTNLRVSVIRDKDGEKVNVEFSDNSGQKNCTYTIIKKNNVMPAKYDDGAIVAENLTFTSYQDENILPAVSYYYAVYVSRYGFNSQLVTCPTPVKVFPDVSGVQQIIVPNGIKVTYVAPKNIKSIEVWKNAGPVAPSKAGEGTKVACDNNGFLDEAAKGETSYLIKCNYQPSGGVLTQSNGYKTTLKPFESIKPLEDVKISQVGDTYVLDCKDGYEGQISIYTSTVKTEIKPGQTYRFTDFSKLSKGLTKVATGKNAEGKITFRLASNQVYLVYPIVFTQQLFVLADGMYINTLKPIENLDYDRNGGDLIIKGIPNPKAKKIIVKVNHTKHAGISDPGDIYEYKVADFARDKQIILKLQSGTLSYISIYAESIDAGISSFSSIQIINDPIDYRETVPVVYCMEYEIDRTKPWKMKITYTANQEVEVPEFYVVKQDLRTPMKVSDGELVDKFSGVKLKKGLFSKEYKGVVVVTLKQTRPSYKFALFPADPSSKVVFRQIRK